MVEVHISDAIILLEELNYLIAAETFAFTIFGSVERRETRIFLVHHHDTKSANNDDRFYDKFENVVFDVAHCLQAAIADIRRFWY